MTFHFRLASIAFTLVAVIVSESRGDFVEFSSAGGKYQPTIVRGDPAGSPPDNVGDRVDANTPSSLYAGVGSVTVSVPNVGTFLGTGTAISPYHVLTAGHVVDVDDNGTIDPSPNNVIFHLNTNAGGPNPSYSVTASQVTIHPDFTGFANPAPNDDLAIITLSSPLPAGVPIYPILQTPITEITTLTLVGYGLTGDGVNGYTSNSFSLDTKRVGYNDLDVIGNDDEGAPNNQDFEVFEMDFDGGTAPNVFGGTSLGNDLETTTGPGDSGGPALVDDNGTLKLAGVNTFTLRLDLDPDPNSVLLGPDAPLFGSGAGGILLYPYLGWINATTAIPEASSFLLVGAVGLLSSAFQSSRRRRDS